ncbi:hypothetical protein CEXT_433341 [Caerostris extrusa]|uniref:Uncharacterized protein n=1 Tax=Caerostris extrusa TaxID=172846 RepID=A0AAV4UX02_CAEEX|nr:hypothetical protein CEXT_433341 [Caerostris extrusa]
MVSEQSHYVQALSGRKMGRQKRFQLLVFSLPRKPEFILRMLHLLLFTCGSASCNRKRFKARVFAFMNLLQKTFPHRPCLLNYQLKFVNTFSSPTEYHSSRTNKVTSTPRWRDSNRLLPPDRNKTLENQLRKKGNNCITKASGDKTLALIESRFSFPTEQDSVTRLSYETNTPKKEINKIRRHPLQTACRTDKKIPSRTQFKTAHQLYGRNSLIGLRIPKEIKFLRKS